MPAATCFTASSVFLSGPARARPSPGPDDIRNVISRVTGGEHSDIDGALRSTIPGADFFFVNPAGVMFGPNASLDVQGSFHVSTADELRFSDGAVFSATNPSASRSRSPHPRRSAFSVSVPPRSWSTAARSGSLRRIALHRRRRHHHRRGQPRPRKRRHAGALSAEAGQITLAAVGGSGASARERRTRRPTRLPTSVSPTRLRSSPAATVGAAFASAAGSSWSRTSLSSSLATPVPRTPAVESSSTPRR